jgi:hypothetical protein
MAKKPKQVAKASKQEIEHLHSRGARNYMWEFPEEVFNGEWWRIEVPNTDVKSAGNSFRTQAHVVYKRRAKVHNKDGAVFVRLSDERVPEPKKT